MKNEVEHIDIPFDELGIFKNAHQQKYQNILMQTLLLSTIGEVHDNKKKYKAFIFITVKSIWIIKKQKIKAILPVKSIIGMVKSFKHPQIVIITRQDVDNLRITTSTQQRCWYIISTLSYIFTYVFTKQLPYISIKQGCLDYFERSSKQKQNNKNINLDRYPKQLLKYQKPFHNIEDIYGHLKPKSKIILQKQMQIQNNDQKQNHIVYLARIKNQNQADPTKQDRYICHYIQKKQQYLQKIYEHQNIEFITQLIYAKTTDFKVQIFFEFSKSLRGTKITPFIFNKIWKLYDKVKQMNNKYQCVFCTDALLMVQRNNIIGDKIIMNTELSENQQEKQWIQGKRVIVMRQFRYNFLNQIVQWEKFMYERDLQTSQQKEIQITQVSNNMKVLNKQHIEQKEQILTQSTSNQPENTLNVQHKQQKINLQNFQNKCYNIGLILFELSTGRHLFSYTPAYIHQQQVLQQQIQLIIQFKQMILQNNTQMDIFPKFLDLGIDQFYKDFINKCIFTKFNKQNQIWQHPWVQKYCKKNHIILGAK